MDKVMEHILASISTGDHPLFIHYLNTVDFSSLNPIQFDAVAQQLFSQIIKDKSNPNITIAFLDFYDNFIMSKKPKLKHSPSLEPSPVGGLVKLAGLWWTKREDISWVVQSLNLNVFSALEHALKEKVLFPIASEKISYGAEDNVNWLALLQMSKDKPTVFDYLQDKIKETAPEAEIPSWVNPPDPGFDWNKAVNCCTYDLERYREFNRSDVEPVDGNMLVEHKLDILELPENNVPEDMLFQLASIGVSTKPQDLIPSDSREYDPDSVFGPRNACRGRECRTGIKGGCRMLTCTCRDFDEEDDALVLAPEDRQSWFKGNCDGCDKRIKDPSHSLRFPVVGGGYTGCFCGVECMIENPPRKVGQYEQLIIGAMMNILKKKGLFDRSNADIQIPDDLPKEGDQLDHPPPKVKFSLSGPAIQGSLFG